MSIESGVSAAVAGAPEASPVSSEPASLYQVFTLFRENSDCRFFGSTSLDLRTRLLLFQNTPKRAAVNAWVQRHGAVRIRPLAIVFDRETADELVALLIGAARTEGVSLLNKKAGFRGKGARHSAETRARMSASHRRPETAARHRAAILARPDLIAQIHTPESLAKSAATRRGVPSSRPPRLSLQQARFVLLSRHGAKKLARRFGVTRKTIRSVRTGKTWPSLRASLEKQGLLPVPVAPTMSDSPAPGAGDARS